ncbi:hypothetical protein [Streptomyces griseosporeus]|uniref:hypothetical protein n=1 Tax=Streptomyces griseosporeus TaxID=1910 RepID=UPI0036F9FD32
MSRRLRTAASAVLIALSCLLVPFGALAAWVAYGLADTGRYVTTMGPLASDPAVQGQIADTVGSGILRHVDAGPARGALGPFVHDAVRSFTRTEAFRTAWDTANRAAHDAVLRSLREGDGRPVTVDLGPVTARLKEQLAADNVPFAHRIPVRHTEVALLPPGELARLRKGYDVLEVAGFWLPVSAVVLAAAGIAVAVRRRRAVTATALGTALGGALLGLAIAVGRRLTLGDLPAEVSEPAAGAVYDALTATLRTTAWLLLAAGLAVALTVTLAGRLTARRGRPPLPGPESAAPAPDPVPPRSQARA